MNEAALRWSMQWRRLAARISPASHHPRTSGERLLSRGRDVRPVRLDVRDPQTGAQIPLTVIGILSETAPYSMAGISTSRNARCLR